jgi:beta-glucosidase
MGPQAIRPDPLYITENGRLPDLRQNADGTLDDPRRIDYHRRHLIAAHDALRDGVDLRGYFAWSLMDNFEWASGFTKRFGLVHVDHRSQRRTPKASALFFSEVIRSNGAIL